MRAINWIVPFAVLAVLTFCIAAAILPNYYRGTLVGKEGRTPIEKEFDIGPFRACIHSVTNKTQIFDGCARIDMDCKFGFGVTNLDDENVEGCTEFNVARGFLILAILFAALSIGLVVFALIRRGVSTGRSVRFWIAIIALVLTTMFLLVTIISAGVHYKRTLQFIEDDAGKTGSFVIESHDETLGNSFILILVSFVAALASTAFFIYFGRSPAYDVESVDYAYLQ